MEPVAKSGNAGILTAVFQVHDKDGNLKGEHTLSSEVSPEKFTEDKKRLEGSPEPTD